MIMERVSFTIKYGIHIPNLLHDLHSFIQLAYLSHLCTRFVARHGRGPRMGTKRVMREK